MPIDRIVPAHQFRNDFLAAKRAQLRAPDFFRPTSVGSPYVVRPYLWPASGKLADNR
jgi:hypothetical protein